MGTSKMCSKWRWVCWLWRPCEWAHWSHEGTLKVMSRTVTLELH